jgi:hypothetical protein
VSWSTVTETFSSLTCISFEESCSDAANSGRGRAALTVAKQTQQPFEDIYGNNEIKLNHVHG